MNFVRIIDLSKNKWASGKPDTETSTLMLSIQIYRELLFLDLLYTFKERHLNEIFRKTTVAIENEAESTMAVSNRSCKMNKDNERDKLVQFESPDESLETHKYFSNVSANIRK